MLKFYTSKKHIHFEFQVTLGEVVNKSFDKFNDYVKGRRVI